MTQAVSSTSSLPRVVRLDPPPDAWQAFRRLAHLPGALFLDSSAVEPVRGRYSYIAASPFESIQAGGEDPFRCVAHRLAPWTWPKIPGLPPFQGGAAGVFGYGLGRAIERIPPPRIDEFQVPDLIIGLYDWVLGFDHVEGTCHLISQGFPQTGIEARRARAEQRAAEVLRLLAGPVPQPRCVEPELALPLSSLAPCQAVPGPEGLLSGFTRQGYVEAVEKAIEYIRSGDIFQVNLSQRLLFPLRSPPIEIYGRLRVRNPAPYSGYLNGGEVTILSSSPEQFLSLSDRVVITRPIKGTRPRGYTFEADAYSQEALRESEKDRAENVMIVDLLRNDLSRVSKPGSVTVPRLFDIERHPTVHHLVSEVRAELKDGLGAMDLLRATFPGGSITGAPKVRAMEIIAELEPTARGPYCGSMGWIAFHGDMGLNILIRTVTAAQGWLQFPVGGGIVALSNPEVEHQETLHKAAGMVRALVE